MKKVLIILASCSVLAGCIGDRTYNIPSASFESHKYSGTYRSNIIDQVVGGTIITAEGEEIPATATTENYGDTVILTGKDKLGNTVTLTGGGCR